jgi:hypothetical protein
LDIILLPVVIDIKQKQKGQSRCFLHGTSIAAKVREVEEQERREREEF